jgi:hypothetical protein
MAKRDHALHEDRSYVDNRLAEIHAFLDASEHQWSRPDKLKGVFERLLSMQDADGSWPDPGGKWTAVQTAVVLRALARLGYTCRSNWPLWGGGEERGGVQKAIDFFRRNSVKIRPVEIPNKWVEDIWDTCQVLLAFASYGLREEYQDAFHDIKATWLQLWNNGRANDHLNWRGPGFLAAMLDVLVAYDPPGDCTHELAHHLVDLIMGNSSGKLPEEWKPEPCWHLALVMRTLAEVPPHVLPKTEKRKIYSVLVPMLLAERGKDEQGIYHQYWGKGLDRYWPMYTARALQGLTAGIPYVDEGPADEARHAIEKGDDDLFSRADEDSKYPGIMIGDLKSTIAVAEYFAWSVASVPVVTLIDAAECLAKQIEFNDARRSEIRGYDYADEVEGGLRIAWLSDLHIAEMASSGRLFARSVKERPWLRLLFLATKNLWTESFASQNLEDILRRVGELAFNHVLITGDITNLARPEQFRLAREKFIALQGKAAVDGNTSKLSSDFWTILPGNHDVGSARAGRKLKDFIEAFGEVCDSIGTTGAFPFSHRVRSPNRSSGLELEIIGLDSTPCYPVQVVGMNARGFLGTEQKDALAKRLESDGRMSGRLRVVALHHAPLMIPFLKSKAAEYFMSLNAQDASDLIALCCTYNVTAILHGHFHVYSPWHAPVGVPHGVTRSMPIIGSPCGTVGVPGEGVEFLELREVRLHKGPDSFPGLSLFRHSLQKGQWGQENLGITIS